jgi:hypothetical protein
MEAGNWSYVEETYGIRAISINLLYTVHTGEALRLGTFERSGGISKMVVWCGGGAM